MEWVHENQDTLGQIAIDLAEIELGLLAVSAGSTLALSGGVVEVGSLGTLSVAALPAVALGVTIAAGGGVAAANGAKNLGQHVDDLHWNNQAGSGASGTAAGGARGVGAPGTPGGYAGRPYELKLMEELGGTDGFSVGGRQFDGKFELDGRSVWYEAKSGAALKKAADEPKLLEKFKSTTGQQAKIARENDADFKLYSENPIPDSVTSWLDRKGISYEVR
jgi:hypothetical protein